MTRIVQACRTLPPRLGKPAGFTLVELVVVMVIIAVLAIVALPRLMDRDFDRFAFRDEVVTALRYAQKSAVSRRRLVCATVNSNSVVLTVAAANPASACSTVTLNGPDGTAAYASGEGVLISGTVPVMYFQPSGVVTADGAGNNPSNFSITVTGTTPISVIGQTAYVN